MGVAFRLTPGNAADAIEIGLIRDPAAFLALRGEWDALFARAAARHQVFQSHVFLRHWLEQYRDDALRLEIVIGRCDGRLAMAWPLVRQRRFGIDTLRFMGIPVAQFGDVLAEPGPLRPALLRAGWEALLGSGADLFEARKLRADSALAGSGLLAAATACEQQDAPFADLARRVDPPGGPSAAYPPRERSNHRRRLRRLAEHGTIRFATLPPGPDASRLAGGAVAMKRAALQRHAVLAPTIDDRRFEAFFRAFAGDAAGGSPLRVSVIYCDDVAIGIDLAIDCKDGAFGHVIATHPDHERGGVGRLLAHHSFASARARGRAVFDLLAPADAYKREHADGLVRVDDFMLPLSLPGRLLCACGLPSLRPALKIAAKSMPSSVARRVAVWSRGAKG